MYDDCFDTKHQSRIKFKQMIFTKLQKNNVRKFVQYDKLKSDQKTI